MTKSTESIADYIQVSTLCYAVEFDCRDDHGTGKEREINLILLQKLKLGEFPFRSSGTQDNFSLSSVVALKGRYKARYHLPDDSNEDDDENEIERNLVLDVDIAMSFTANLQTGDIDSRIVKNQVMLVANPTTKIWLAGYRLAAEKTNQKPA